MCSSDLVFLVISLFLLLNSSIGDAEGQPGYPLRIPEAITQAAEMADDIPFSERSLIPANYNVHELPPKIDGKGKPLQYDAVYTCIFCAVSL